MVNIFCGDIHALYMLDMVPTRVPSIHKFNGIRLYFDDVFGHGVIGNCCDSRKSVLKKQCGSGRKVFADSTCLKVV